MPITTEPAPNPPPVGTVKVRHSGALDGVPWGVGSWLLTTGAPGPGDLSDLATDMAGVFVTNLLPLICVDVGYTECSVRYWDGSVWTMATSSFSHVGGMSGLRLTSQASSLISWGIGTSYRGGKPRTYLPQPSNAAVGFAHEWSGGHIANLTAGGAGYLSDVNGLAPGGITTVTLGVVRFFSGGAALAPPVFDPFLSANGQPRVCSQRRRLGPEL